MLSYFLPCTNVCSSFTQVKAIRTMRERGCKVLLSSPDMSKLDDMKSLLALPGMPVAGIFHLAAVFEDRSFAAQVSSVSS